LELVIKKLDPSFESPIGMKGKRGNAAAWGEYAAIRKKRQSGKLKIYYSILTHLYKAVRIVVNSRQTGLELAIQYLIMTGIFPGSPNTTFAPETSNKHQMQ
jgi:hypothetical protein